jgi:propanol-preferring alcohol dehydrogenase
MKAMILTAPGQPFELCNVPDPIPNKGEAIARVISCGAGLTTQHIRAGRTKINYPRIIGHEITAEIVELGSHVQNLRVGDPVTAYYYLTCGRCYWCLNDRETLCDNFSGYVGKTIDGGYAEFIKLPAKNFLKLPKHLDYKKYAPELGVITDAIATPIKVIKKTRIKPNDTIAIIGAGGGLGLHMVLASRWAKANVIAVDISDKKLNTCKELGAYEIINSLKTNLTDGLLELTNGDGVDVVIDFVANDKTLDGSIRSLRKGGRLAVLGGGGVAKPVAISGEWIKSREIEILGSKYATKNEVLEAIDIVSRGEIWPKVTETCFLKDVEAMHERIEDGLVTGRAAIIIDRS